MSRSRARPPKDAAREQERLERRRAAVPAITYPPQLPVSACREELLRAIGEHQVVVVAGETGSGKTTQLPKLCLELGRGVAGMIAHTQPRRLAARTVAQRIADELGVPLGTAVGYAVRFTDRTREDTLVRLMTDGLLLAEIARDRDLLRYDTIIIDEAHERSLNVDFLLGYLHGLLARRPDLKLIITSATIDPGRFAQHFGDAPVVEVSGRTFPVEVRYRPEEPGAEREPLDAIGDAVDELLAAAPGDVLVFLSGEREIRDAAEALRGRLAADVDVLPLYARLSSEEQLRVFAPHRGRRVILATNVAETSLTVPGIGGVVDPGLARVSRYSARLKVQRLPIEPVSQASARQRAGRCGRTANGICIRLYAEEDFEARPAYTDPEILRTSLASVILQMAALRLGAIEDFPFLDPPDRRQVRDGVALLQELGALEADRALTPLGRRLARLPVDPRYGRMVLEAGRRHCAEEVTVIVAGLSIQDPRERPAEHRAEADTLHARFADEDSDFLGYLRLWRHLEDLGDTLSRSAMRRRCRAEYLHTLRVREWQDLVAQLRRAAQDVGIDYNDQPAEAEPIHLALLSGLLSHVGMRDAQRRDYVGARGARFSLWPGSGLARAQPSWVMVAELVETSRLWGRTVARIQPSWVEPLAEHLVRRTHGEPRWERRRAAAVVTERVLLFGLPVVTGRTVGWASVDPAGARDLFLRRALVEGDWDTRHAFAAENAAAVEEVDGLEQRARRRDLRVTDDAVHAFFDARVPESVVSGPTFDRWWRDAGRADPGLLRLTRDVLLGEDATQALRGRPTAWRQGDAELALSYRFDPADARDGVTLHVPLTALPALREDGLDWLVPALRLELVTALLRTLPKDLRRALVPLPETAAALVQALPPRRGALLEALAAGLEALRGVRVTPTDWAPSRLPAHLRMHVAVTDADGTTLAEGDDVTALREALAPRLRRRLSDAAAGLERHGMRAWEIGELPRTVALAGTDGAVRGHPALVDEGDAVGVRVLETPEAQAATMAAGTRRLLLLTVPSPARAVRDGLGSAAQLTLAAAPHGSLAAVIDDATAAAVDALVAQAGGPAWDAAGFARLTAHVAAGLVATTRDAVALIVEIVDLARDVAGSLERLTAPAVVPARQDLAGQLGRLVFAGFASATGLQRLPDVRRYLRAMQRRLERLPDTVAADRDRLTTIVELEALHDAQVTAAAATGPVPEALREVGWMLQELRVAQFAQGVGTRGPVSAKRIRRALEQR